MPRNPRPRRRLRFVFRLVLAVPILLLVLIASAPTILSTSIGKKLVVSKVNAMLAPSRIELSSWRVSWMAPLRLNGLSLRDKSGKTLVSARQATLDRSAWQLLAKRPDYGTLTFSGARIDVERKGDGTIDVTDAIAPLLVSDPNSKSDPNTSITVKILDGSLRLVTPELTEPVIARNMKATVHAAAAPAPLNVLVELENAPGETLRIEGRYDSRAESTDLSAELKSRHWPLAVAMSGVTAKGRLDGTIQLSQNAGGWTTSGDATLHDLDATGEVLSGDRVRLSRVVSGWDVVGGENAWSVKRFELKTHVGSVSGHRTPTTNGNGTSMVQGRIDLAALAKLLPHTMRLKPGLVVEKGLADVRAEIVETAGTQDIDVRISLPGLSARDGERAIVLDDPSTVVAHVVRSADGIQVDRVACRTGFCDLAASGDMAKGVRLKGILDLGVLQNKLGAIVDFGAYRVAGRAEISGTYKKTNNFFHAGLKADIADLSITGATAEPIDQKEVRIDATADGPDDATGLPLGWSKVGLSVAGTDVALNTIAKRNGESIDLTGEIAATFSRAEHDGQAEARIRGHWHPGNHLDFDLAEILIRPTDPAAKAAEILVAAKGRFDATEGTLALGPIPSAGGGVIGPAAGGLTIAGFRGTGDTVNVAGRLTADLSRLDRAVAYWTAGSPQGVAGRLNVGIDASRDPAGLVRFDARLDSPDIVLPGAAEPEGPILLSTRGDYQGSTSVLQFAQLHLETYYGMVDASGSLRDPGGASVVDVKGKLFPNWKLVDAMLVESIEPNARLTARARPFRVKGPLNGGSLVATLRGLDAELGVDLAGASAFGVIVGPAAVVARLAEGRMSIDPIETTINNGRLLFRPRVEMTDAGDLAILLDSSSTIIGAEIDDEVSTRVLSYAAPMLHQAAEARGHLTVGVDRAMIPIIDSAGRTVDVAGHLKFDQVTFGPGPMARQLIGVMGEQEPPALRLNQTVPFWVSNGKVGQKGLAVVVSPKVQLDFDGAVGFDRSLALRVGMPLNAAMLGAHGLVGQIVEGTRVGVPISGTLSRPVIDRRAIQVALREASRSMVKRGVQAGVGQLLDRVEGMKPGPSAKPSGSRGLAEDALDLFLPATRRETTPPR